MVWIIKRIYQLLKQKISEVKQALKQAGGKIKKSSGFPEILSMIHPSSCAFQASKNGYSSSRVHICINIPTGKWENAFACLFQLSEQYHSANIELGHCRSHDHPWTNHCSQRQEMCWLASPWSGAPPFGLRVEPPARKLSTRKLGAMGKGGGEWMLERLQLFTTPRPLVHYIKDMAQTHVCSLWAHSKW